MTGRTMSGTVLRGLAGRVALVVLLAVSPLLALLGFEAVAARDAAISDARTEVRRFADLAAAAESSLLDGSHRFLQTLATSRRLDGTDPAACKALLAGVLAAEPTMISLAAADDEGRVWCSSPALDGPVEVGSETWFDRALSGDFAVGSVDRDPVAGGLAVTVAHRVDAGGVLFGGLSLEAFVGALGSLDLPTAAALIVVDPAGLVVARDPDPEGFVGTDISTTPLGIALLDGSLQDIETPGLDGIPRIAAVADVGRHDVTGLRLAIGYATSEVLATANEAITLAALAIAFAVAVSLAILILGTRRFILGPVDRLLDASRRLAGGDLAARAGDVGSGEVGELARSFDSMAAALERRTEDLEAQVVARTAELATALAEVEDLYENAPVGYHSLDAEGRFVRINETELRWLGRRRDEVLGKPFADVLTDEGRRRLAEEFPAFVARGEVRDLRYDLVTAEGSLLPVRIGATAVRDAEGRFIRSRSVVEDITERQRAERWAAELFDSFTAPVSIYDPVRDADGTVVDYVRVYANPRLAEILGRPMSDVLGASLRATTLPQHLETTAASYDRVLASGIAERMPDLEVPDPVTGGTVVLSVRVSRLGDRIAIVSRDVTVERTAEREISAAREAAEEANRAKSEFLSRMSHELRTPLNAIIGFAQLLEMDELSGEQRESVHQVLAGGRHLLELINEVLDISRIESRTLSISPEPVSVRDAAKDVAELIDPLAREAGVVLDPAALPGGAYVHADRQRLRQVLLNLLSNAVKYSRRGGHIRLAARSVETEEPETPAMLRFEVADEGPGIEPAMLERVFAPFDRLGAERSDIEGTGLGLALSKALVEAMGGRIGVDSEVGRGSTFWFELPLVEPAAVAPDRASEATASASILAPAAEAGTRKLLYIEDNPSNLRLVERALERRPAFRLLAAMLGSLGIELAEEHQPDLILLDLHLPDLSGEEVLARLRAEPATASIPVVVLSAEASERVRDRLRVLGAADYLAKPIDLAELYRVIDERAARAGGPEAR